MIKNNTILNSTIDGIHIEFDDASGYSNLEENTVHNNTKRGIVIYDATDVRMRDNSIADNKYNFGVWGDSPYEFNHDINESNTVNHKPIYYWRNHEHDFESIPSDAGYVGIFNTSFVTVENLTLTNNGQGVLVASHGAALYNYIRINNVTATDNELGVIIFSSSNNYIENCNISNNDYNGYYEWASGIYLNQSSYDTINNNTVSHNTAKASIFLESSSNNNTIFNNTCYSNGYGIDIRFNSNDNFILENTIYDNTLDGIIIGHSTGNVINENLVYSSTVNGIRFLYASSNMISNNIIYDTIQFYGIYISLSSNNNILIDNTVYDNDIYGIYISSSNYTNLTNNHIYDNPMGISLQYSSNNNMTGNNISSNDNYGIYLTTTSWNDIYDNTITLNGNAGILCGYYSHNNITSNDIENNTVYGVYSFYGSNPVINYNNIKNNEYGVWSQEDSNPMINNNTISGNTEYGIKNADSGVYIHAEYNYWGASNGPLKDDGGLPDPRTNDGDGDEVSDYVYFDPWLSSPP
jgi:parallel beta-helix repeat protein